MFVLKFGEDFLLHFKVSTSSILGRELWKNVVYHNSHVLGHPGGQWLKTCLPLQGHLFGPGWVTPCGGQVSLHLPQLRRARELQLRPEAAKEINKYLKDHFL